MRFFILGIASFSWLFASGCTTSQTVHVNDKSRIVLERKGSEASAPETGLKNKRLTPPGKDKPVQITSDRMAYQEQGKVTLFTGHVNVNQGRAWLYTPYLQVYSKEGVAMARQGIRLIDHERGVTVTARELDYLEDLSNVHIRGDIRVATHDDEGQALHIRSKQMRWDQQAETVVAQGEVVVHYQDTTATAEVLTYNRAKRSMELAVLDSQAAKMPVITQQGNMLTGKVITLLIKEKTYEVKGSAKAVIIPESRQAEKQE